MTDETEKPMTATEFVERNRELKFAKGGRLYFPDFPLGGEIDLMRHRKPTFDRGEAIVPKDDPRGRIIRHGETTGRWSGRHFTMHVVMDDRATPEFKRVKRTLLIYRDAAYYGKRVATLLHSTDPRQRKRGRRLRDQRFSVGLNFQNSEERLLAHYRAMHPDIASFWNTNLGEPYDPERYRKD